MTDDDDLKPAQQLAGLHAAINTMLDSVCAYRAACIERGFSAKAAEAMAVHYHSCALRLITPDTVVKP